MAGHSGDLVVDREAGPLPGSQFSEQPTEAPAPPAGSFFKTEGMPREEVPPYIRYLQLQKGLLASSKTRKLLAIYRKLAQDSSPAHLTAAGWAIAEAALITHNKSMKERHGMLEGAEESWQNALDGLLEKPNPDNASWNDVVLRTRMIMSVLPYMHDIVSGKFSRTSSQAVFGAQLNIAKCNDRFIDNARRNDDLTIGVHVGLGYELLGQLITNAMHDEGQLMMPAPIRADTGYTHAYETHDLIFVSSYGGRIRAIVPAEVKSSARKADRARYKALLISGEKDLNFIGLSQSETLAAIEEATCELPDRQSYSLLRQQREHIIEMISRYTRGTRMQPAYNRKGLTRFYEAQADQPSRVALTAQHS